jgi:hypothetical protein
MRVVKGREMAARFFLRAHFPDRDRRAVYSGQARRAAATDFELQFAAPPVATA